LKNSTKQGTQHSNLDRKKHHTPTRRSVFATLGGKARTKLVLLLIILILAIANPGGVRGDSQGDEYRVKAAFLFHFAQLVEWPADSLGGSSNPIVFCTERPDPFGGNLETTVEGKRIDSRPIRVEHLKNLEQARRCQLLFIRKSSVSNTSAILTTLGQAPIVTVGEEDDFVREGGMIGFSLEDNRIRFEINLTAARRLHIKISSRLLGLATNVIGIAEEK
jgi:uncharacterized protein DUF4154